MAFATDSNRPQLLGQPPPTACLTASRATSEAPSVLMHPCPKLMMTMMIADDDDCWLHSTGMGVRKQTLHDIILSTVISNQVSDILRVSCDPALLFCPHGAWIMASGWSGWGRFARAKRLSCRRQQREAHHCLDALGWCLTHPWSPSGPTPGSSARRCTPGVEAGGA